MVICPWVGQWSVKNGKIEVLHFGHGLQAVGREDGCMVDM